MDKKTPRKSASKWDEIGERALLELWAEMMPRLRGCRKNSHILMEMASELAMQGFKYTPEELRTKMHNMTTRYRKEKLKIDSTGYSPSEWDLYNDMEHLFAPFNSYHPEGLVCDSINDISSNIKSEPLPSPSPSSTVFPSPPSPSLSIPDASPPYRKLCTSANKNKNSVEKILKYIEKNVNKIQDDIKSTSERMLAIEEEKKEILKSFAAKEAEFQKTLLEFLQKP